MSVTLWGIVKNLSILIADFALAHYFLGTELAIALTAGIALYTYLGEYLALLKDRAIRPKHLPSWERSKLTCALANLSEDVQRVSGKNISNLKISVIPSDSINAYAYGFRNIAVTRGLLSNCDDATLCSVLAHEVSHVRNMDPIFSRAMFASVTLMTVALIVLSFFSSAVLWIIFALLCLLGLCGGLFSMFLFQGLSKLVKGCFTLAQRVLIFLYQAIFGLISRRCEYRADRYSCQLGYGPQLSYFLSRFVERQELAPATLHELIYASHPPTGKRIARIEQQNTNIVLR